VHHFPLGVTDSVSVLTTQLKFHTELIRLSWPTCSPDMDVPDMHYLIAEDSYLTVLFQKSINLLHVSFNMAHFPWINWINLYQPWYLNLLCQHHIKLIHIIKYGDLVIVKKFQLLYDTKSFVACRLRIMSQNVSNGLGDEGKYIDSLGKCNIF
jgi:hypothetical protein